MAIMHDTTHHWRLMAPRLCFTPLNRGKKSVVLNVKKPADKDAFLKLLATADVLVETFRPEVMAKLGLNPRDLVARFPKLIVCSISGNGQVCVYCRHFDRYRESQNILYHYIYTYAGRSGCPSGGTRFKLSRSRWRVGHDEGTVFLFSILLIF